MISFDCPYCDQTIRAKPEMVGKRGKCPVCKGSFLVPDDEGEARVVYATMKLLPPDIPITAKDLPPICICCGRDAPRKGVDVLLWSHKQSTGAKLGVFGAKAAGYFLFGGQAGAGHLGFALVSGFTEGSEPFPLFRSVPLCRSCDERDAKRIRLAGVEGRTLLIDGIPSRLANAVHELAEREAEAFEQSLTQSHAPHEGEGFDWRSIR